MLKTFQSRHIFWFSLSLAFAVILSFNALNIAFSDSYVVQDDARQHVFWMERFTNPHLFPQDPIADYFQSIAPLGYTTLYKFFTALGISPFIFNKILPFILGIITTVYAYKVCLEIFPVPFAAFLTTFLLNQNMWLMDVLSSGTSRAFIYPLLLAFIYYLLRRSLLFCSLFIVLQATFYPHTVFISVGVLCLQIFSWQKGYLSLVKENIIFLITGFLTAAMTILIYAPKTTRFGSAFSIDEARLLPELSSLGSTAFFVDNPFFFWLVSSRSGFFPHEWGLAIILFVPYGIIAVFALFLPFINQKLAWFPLIEKLDRRSVILPQILIASSIAFFIAHLMLFKMHLPSRYIQHSIRILMAIGDSIVLTVMIDELPQWIKKYAKKPSFFQQSIIVKSISLLLILISLASTYVAQNHPQYWDMLGYMKGESKQIYQFLREQPKDSLIASLTKESDFIPVFAQRSVLMSEEFSLPYHKNYYYDIHQKTIDAIEAQYTDNPQKFSEIINKYGIDFWLLDKNAFQVQYIQNNSLIKQYQVEAKQIISFLEQKEIPILSKLTSQCTVFEQNNLILLQGQCLVHHSS